MTPEEQDHRASKFVNLGVSRTIVVEPSELPPTRNVQTPQAVLN